MHTPGQTTEFRISSTLNEVATSTNNNDVTKTSAAATEEKKRSNVARNEPTLAQFKFVKPFTVIVSLYYSSFSCCFFVVLVVVVLVVVVMHFHWIYLVKLVNSYPGVYLFVVHAIYLIVVAN